MDERYQNARSRELNDAFNFLKCDELIIWLIECAHLSSFVLSSALSKFILRTKQINNNLLYYALNNRWLNEKVILDLIKQFKIYYPAEAASFVQMYPLLSSVEYQRVGVPCDQFDEKYEALCRMIEAKNYDELNTTICDNTIENIHFMSSLSHSQILYCIQSLVRDINLDVSIENLLDKKACLIPPHLIDIFFELIQYIQLGQFFSSNAIDPDAIKLRSIFHNILRHVAITQPEMAIAIVECRPDIINKIFDVEFMRTIADKTSPYNINLNKTISDFIITQDSSHLLITLLKKSSAFSQYLNGQLKQVIQCKKNGCFTIHAG